MVIETPQYPFFEWLPQALVAFLFIAGSLAAIAIIFGYIVATLRHGPIKALSITGRTIYHGIVDLISLSPRRVAALTWLAVKDSIRRRVVIVFGVFILIVLFAGWFLDPGTAHPLRLYISFVLPATSYLVLALVLFLSVFSIPADLKSKTLHTVVTKPVHASEIVLGRMLGYIAVGTILLVVMGAISYVFVLRGLNHTHKVTEADLESVGVAVNVQEGDSGTKTIGAQKGTSSLDHRHRHDVNIKSNGQGILEMTHDHWHPITRKTVDGKTTYEVGNTQGMLVARVPIYGKLHFVNEERKTAEKGTNVGDEWAYRSYILGGSLAAAVWSFEGVTPESFPDDLQVEMTLGVFRTYKGDIVKGIPGSLLIRNPKTGLTVEAKIFSAKEFETDIQTIPHTITPSSVYYLDAVKASTVEPNANDEEDKDEENQNEEQSTGDQLDQIVGYERREVENTIKNKPNFDLFEDLVEGGPDGKAGRVEIWLQCLAPDQYLGAAQADLYLHAENASFFLNFVKGYFGAWMQMVLVASFGVMFSTFLSGPIAMLATVGMLIGGFFRSTVLEIALGQNYGGGPAESIIRIFTHQNIVSKAEPGLQTTVAQMFDKVVCQFLWTAAQILPEFGRFNCSNYLAYGFNISSTWISEHGLTVFGFFILLFVAGSFFLKTREVAK